MNQLKKWTQCLNNGISFNVEKCAFCVNSKVLLGHIVYEDGLLVDPKKINIITDHYYKNGVQFTSLNHYDTLKMK